MSINLIGSRFIVHNIYFDNSGDLEKNRYSEPLATNDTSSLCFEGNINLFLIYVCMFVP